MHLTHNPHAPTHVKVVIANFLSGPCIPRTPVMKKQLLFFLCYVPAHGAMCPVQAVWGNLPI